MPSPVVPGFAAGFVARSAPSAGGVDTVGVAAKAASVETEGCDCDDLEGDSGAGIAGGVDVLGVSDCAAEFGFARFREPMAQTEPARRGSSVSDSQGSRPGCSEHALAINVVALS